MEGVCVEPDCERPTVGRRERCDPCRLKRKRKMQSEYGKRNYKSLNPYGNRVTGGKK